ILPGLAQATLGQSRFVLLSGAVALYLAWPKACTPLRSLARCFAYAPLLGLAFALDLQAGLEWELASPLALHAGVLCLACCPLGAVRSGGARRWWPGIFGLWFLLPMVLGLWAHVAQGAGFTPAAALRLSPVGSLCMHHSLSPVAPADWNPGLGAILIGACLVRLWMERAGRQGA
ncbi:MAG: hypothetical protein KDB61_05445, partial [Planctomycetes bacterium]|nr:hypothetical protein [Planctomycetota bacterium]